MLADIAGAQDVPRDLGNLPTLCYFPIPVVVPAESSGPFFRKQRWTKSDAGREPSRVNRALRGRHPPVGTSTPSWHGTQL